MDTASNRTGTEKATPEEAESATLEIAKEHPICVYHTIIDPTRKNTIGVYGSYSAAAEAFARMRRRRADRLRFIGQAILAGNRTGRPTDMYFNGDWWKPKTDNLRHTVKETDAALAIRSAWPTWKISRGPRTGDERFDLLIETPTEKIGAEIDCGTMSEQKVRERWAAIRDWQGKVLILVAPKHQQANQRVLELMRWGDDIEDFAYYVPLSAFIKNPDGNLFVDCELKRGFSLEKVLEQP